jgi:hypothetical protein
MSTSFAQRLAQTLARQQQHQRAHQHQPPRDDHEQRSGPTTTLYSYREAHRAELGLDADDYLLKSSGSAGAVASGLPGCQRSGLSSPTPSRSMSAAAGSRPPNGGTDDAAPTTTAAPPPVPLRAKVDDLISMDDLALDRISFECLECGARRQVGSHCGVCSSPLALRVPCGACGKTARGNFCCHCGSKLNANYASPGRRARNVQAATHGGSSTAGDAVPEEWQGVAAAWRRRSDVPQHHPTPSHSQLHGAV